MSSWYRRDIAVVHGVESKPGELVQDLPDNEMYCPPITIRCVDCRNFGRFILVGTHVINNVYKFFYNPPAPSSRTATENTRKFVGNSLHCQSACSVSNQSKTDDV